MVVGFRVVYNGRIQSDSYDSPFGFGGSFNYFEARDGVPHLLVATDMRSAHLRVPPEALEKKEKSDG